MTVVEGGDVVVATSDGSISRVQYVPVDIRLQRAAEATEGAITQEEEWVQIGPLSLPVRS